MVSDQLIAFHDTNACSLSLIISWMTALYKYVGKEKKRKGDNRNFEEF